MSTFRKLESPLIGVFLFFWYNNVENSIRACMELCPLFSVSVKGVDCKGKSQRNSGSSKCTSTSGQSLVLIKNGYFNTASCNSYNYTYMQVGDGGALPLICSQLHACTQQ